MSTRHPIRSIFRLSLLLHNLSKEAERKSGLSIFQWSILKQLVDMPGASAQELSEATGVHPSTLSQSLKRLIRRRFVFVGEDPRDSRKKVISLTRQGKQALDLAECEMERIGIDLGPLQGELYALEDGLSGSR